MTKKETNISTLNFTEKDLVYASIENGWLITQHVDKLRESILELRKIKSSSEAPQLITYEI